MCIKVSWARSGERSRGGWRPRPEDSAAGLMLIEMLFAIGIVGLTLSLIFGAWVTLSEVSQTAEQRTIASTHLTTLLESLRSSSHEAVLSQPPSSLVGLMPGETVVVDCLDASGATVVLPLPPGVESTTLPNPLRVRATVTWLVGKGKTRSMSGWVLHEN